MLLNPLRMNQVKRTFRFLWWISWRIKKWETSTTKTTLHIAQLTKLHPSMILRVCSSAFRKRSRRLGRNWETLRMNCIKFLTNLTRKNLGEGKLLWTRKRKTWWMIYLQRPENLWEKLCARKHRNNKTRGASTRWDHWSRSRSSYFTWWVSWSMELIAGLNICSKLLETSSSSMGRPSSQD